MSLSPTLDAQPPPPVRALAASALRRLLERVRALRDVDGTGQEAYGLGDPRIPERRDAVGTLMCAVELGLLDRGELEALGPRVALDLRWLEAADWTDIQPGASGGAFWWAANHGVSARELEQAFERQVAAGRRQAQELAAGTRPYYEAMDGNVIGVAFLPSPELRASALADILLQFRGLADPVDAASPNNEAGPSLLAGLRWLLASPWAGAQGPEYALLRAVVGAHPLSSSNGLFEARNAMGRLFLDGDPGNRTPRRTKPSHATAWLRTEIPPGATYSPYAAIHWNFGADSRRNIELFVRHWMFAVGPEEERARLFLRLTGALEQARSGDPAGARARLLEEAEGPAAQALRPLLAALEAAPESGVGDAILAFLTRPDVCTKDLGTRPEANLQLAARVYRCVCLEEVGPRTLEAQLFRAGRAWPQVAELILALEARDAPGALSAVAAAREALRRDFDQLRDGARRHQRLLADRLLERISLEALGSAVDRTGELRSAPERRLALVGLHAALRCARASGLDAFAPAPLDGLGRELERAAGEPSAPAERCRALSAQARAAERRLVQGLRAFVEERAARIALSQAWAVPAQSALERAAAFATERWRRLRRRLDRADDAFFRWIDIIGNDGAAVNRVRWLFRNIHYQRFFFYRQAEKSALWKAKVRPLLQRWKESRPPPLLDLDPLFVDQLLKETPLHYASALAEKGTRAGLAERLGPRALENVAGMRLLNSVGPVVFSRVLVVQGPEELSARALGRGDLVVCLTADEKKRMPMGGGLVVDARDAPGGNSHLSLYAMGIGLTLIALPELAARFADFFRRAGTPEEGGVYFDDSGGQVRLMTVACALEQGALSAADRQRLAPGTNRTIAYLAPGGPGAPSRVAAAHEVRISELRPHRRIELYLPSEALDGQGRSSLGLEALGALGSRGRHLAGEKAFVLAQLRDRTALGDLVPGGAVIPAGRIRALYREAGLEAMVEELWERDPAVGAVDAGSFLRSAFYSDPAYRQRARERLHRAVGERLGALLLDPSRREGISRAGEALLGELKAAGLPRRQRWIARSSFMGEDRPGKSGAGQYLSVPDLVTARDRLVGIARVLQSAWDAAPVENNVAEEVELRYLGASVLVQRCLSPEVSGVAISRDVELGTRGIVSYQLVPGFGGGVEGGAAEEGIVSAFRGEVRTPHPGREGGLVDGRALAQLRELVLRVERLFNERVEPGQDHAVDVEVARVGGRWYVVQARAVLLGAG